MDGYTQVGVMKPETGNWSMLTHSRQHGNVTNVAWAPDGSSIYYDRIEAVPEGIYSVPVLGGDERLVFPRAFRPEALPDGSLLAVKLNSGAGVATLPLLARNRAGAGSARRRGRSPGKVSPIRAYFRTAKKL